MFTINTSGVWSLAGNRNSTLILLLHQYPWRGTKFESGAKKKARFRPILMHVGQKQIDAQLDAFLNLNIVRSLEDLTIL